MHDESKRHQSGKGNSRCSITQEPPATAIARHVSERVHLEPVPTLRFHSFLITLLNPIERIKSWYYYLHPDFPPEKLPLHKKGCADFAFFQCWPTLQSFASVGLNGTSNSYSSSHDECTAWAWGIATGKIHCWHNFWNYNRTYGTLLGTQKEIFAIRTEHTWDDWVGIDRMLGGTGKLEKLPDSKNDFQRETQESDS